jgi:hypothetical protein
MSITSVTSQPQEDHSYEPSKTSSERRAKEKMTHSEVKSKVSLAWTGLKTKLWLKRQEANRMPKKLWGVAR